jgi:2-iminobutanoate/2-iminopropanoate deaminase
MRETIFSENAPQPIGPYSQGVKVGNTYYLSGQIGLNPRTGSFASDTDVVIQAKQVMENIKALLESQGLTLDHVVKTSILLNSMNDFPKVNEVYAQYYTGFYPARETVEVSRLPKDALVEISVICVKPE